MSTKAKILFLGALLCLVTALAIEYQLGMWINLNSILVAVASVLVVVAVYLDGKFFLEFLSMRTTKHGLNMGVMIFLALTSTVCVNYLAKKHNKTFDFTKEKLNSLSDQSQKLLDGLQNDIEVKVFYNGGSTERDERQAAKQALALYEDHGKVKVRFINSYVDAITASEYLKDLPDREQQNIFMFVEYGGRKVRVEDPFDESNITSAMIKATRQGVSKVYFIKGHGERDLNSDQAPGIKEFVKALGEASFKAEPLSLLEKPEIPTDAAVVAIVGPAAPYLEPELVVLRKYAQNGGRLFISLDPGQRHNLANLTKSLGVQFANNFLIRKTKVENLGPVTILGPLFDPTSEITNKFPMGNSTAIFNLASEVSAAGDKPQDIAVQELVKSDANTFGVTELKAGVPVPMETKPVTIAVSAKGSGQNSFEAIVVGDSDFMSNQQLSWGVNRDLALNAIAYLTNQKDLISIKPKLPKGSMIMLNPYQTLGILIFGLALPLGFIVTAVAIWFRRRSA